MAYELAKYKQNVVVNFYPGLEEDAEDTVEQIQALGGKAIAIPADCTDEEQVISMFDTTVSHFGKVDVLREQCWHYKRQSRDPYEAGRI